MSAFINFDFYGAGNIGDDLMLAGFLSEFKDNIPMSCFIGRDSESQRRRFPQVAWVEDLPGRAALVNASDCLLGIGDTPFQTAGNHSMMKKLSADVDAIAGRDIPFFMIGVGAEAEARTQTDIARKFLWRVDHIWTRDEFTSRILLEDFGYSPERLSTGSDLANIWLSRAFANGMLPSSREIDLGICYYDEHTNGRDIRVLREFVREYSRDKKVQLFANETRDEKPYERWIYRKIMGAFGSLFRESRTEVFAPDYQNASLPELVNHFRRYNTVISSRYHALLTAAWAGCRVVGHGRGSKVNALAHELGIPLVENPISVSKLTEAVEHASIVERKKLEDLWRRAQYAVDELKTLLNIDYNR